MAWERCSSWEEACLLDPDLKVVVILRVLGADGLLKSASLRVN